MIKFVVSSLLVSAAFTCAAQQCGTDPGATVNGLAAGASATFTVSDGSITVMLTNNQSDPRSAAQLLNGLSFTLSTGQTVGTLSSSSAVIRQIARNGSFSDGGPSATGWAVADNVNGGMMLCVLCTDLGGVGPSHLLIGDPGYANANASIKGNKPHNPFTAGTAQFVINVPTLLSTATVTNATFFFGTAAGVSAGGTCVPGGGIILPGTAH
jgi:hypothetical protein